MQTASYWSATRSLSAFPAIDRDIEVDVVVVGAHRHHHGVSPQTGRSPCRSDRTGPDCRRRHQPYHRASDVRHR